MLSKLALKKAYISTSHAKKKKKKGKPTSVLAMQNYGLLCTMNHQKTHKGK
jgi:hypothetical protein